MQINLYRKYRPSRFDEVVGQNVIVKTLSNSIKNENIAHAYLFTGIRGTGKTSIAKILASSVNCENIENPLSDGCECKFCLQNSSESPDIFEIDAASNNGVEEVRKIIENVKFLPISAKYKVYIIDEVHMLSKGAFNALLKTLEEPPKHVIFILATTEPNKIPMTILSRCQRFDFNRINDEEMKLHLIELLKKESIPFEEEAIEKLVSFSQGSMRDLLSLATKVISLNNDITIKSTLESLMLSDKNDLELLVKNIFLKEPEEVSKIFKQIMHKGVDEYYLINEIINLLKNTYLFNSKFDKTLIIEMITELSKLEVDLKFVKNPPMYLEVYLINFSIIKGNEHKESFIKPSKTADKIKDDIEKDVEMDTSSDNFIQDVLEDIQDEPVLEIEEKNTNIDEKNNNLELGNKFDNNVVNEDDSLDKKQEEIQEISFNNHSIIDTLVHATKQDKEKYKIHFNNIINILEAKKEYGLSKFFELSELQGASSNSIVVTLDSTYFDSYNKRLSDINIIINDQIGININIFLLKEEDWFKKRKEYVQAVKEMKQKDIYKEAIKIFGEEVTNKI